MTAFSCFGSSWRGTGQDLDLWCEKDKQLQIIRAKANKLYKSLEMLFSVDGGPLTDNVVFVSDQRGHRFLAYSGLFGERVHDLERSTLTLSSIDDKIVVITDV